MQSVLVYGRLFSRAVANGIYSVSTGGQGTAAPHTSPPAASASSSPSQGVEAEHISTASSHRKKLRFLTAVSGFPKNRTLEKVKPGKFGDDAYFVVKHAQGDVIGPLAGCSGSLHYKAATLMIQGLLLLSGFLSIYSYTLREWALAAQLLRQDESA
ncbi:hypothetical protein E2C01_018798 [Portunus trituberculatus]|uniref:Uncharacterized protein n=1 Tax=Portunus trituberculatus TaxID=210409 RepID=A0A5B7DXG8_PORTR|nr:hypothetical protein [Portunus trituberculatus]